MGHRILVVEDEALIAEGLADLLRHDGHEVCGKAASASVAVQVARTTRPDVVLMDIKLGRHSRDGLCAAQIILAKRRCGLVFLTAYSNDHVRKRIRETLPDALLISKPASGDEIAAAVRHAGNQF